MKREHKGEESHLREDEKSESILMLGGRPQSSRIAFITSFKRGERLETATEANLFIISITFSCLSAADGCIAVGDHSLAIVVTGLLLNEQLSSGNKFA